MPRPCLRSSWTDWERLWGHPFTAGSAGRYCPSPMTAGLGSGGLLANEGRHLPLLS